MNRCTRINEISIRSIGQLIRCYSTQLSPKQAQQKWKSVVGIEIHAQIATNCKLFSGAENCFSRPINSSVALLDSAIPGSLPRLNRRAVEAGVKTALALSCRVNEISHFDRKHYFYADLPAGYQITQQRAPLASDGHLTFPIFIPGVTKKPYYKKVRLHQLQLEQDSGKSLHDDIAGISLIDLNRAGVPLMELVFDPDLTNGEEAASLVKELVLILTSLGTCNCKMEEGSLRVDANISIHKPNTPLGVRTEVKNIGSIRGVAQAINHEIERQIKIKDEGGKIVNETRMWDAAAKLTIAMRDKEVVQDYRFMPEPNLPPLHVMTKATAQTNADFVNAVKLADELPPLPNDIRESLVNNYGVSQEISIILVNEKVLFNYFEGILSENSNRTAKITANFLINELLTICNKHKIELEDCKFSTSHLGQIIDMIGEKQVNLQLARLILTAMLNSSKSPAEIAEENNWKLIRDPQKIKIYCDEVFSTETGQKMVEAYNSGKTKVLFAIAGEVNKKSNNLIDMSICVDIIKSELEKLKEK